MRWVIAGIVAAAGALAGGVGVFAIAWGWHEGCGTVRTQGHRVKGSVALRRATGDTFAYPTEGRPEIEPENAIQRDE